MKRLSDKVSREEMDGFTVIEPVGDLGRSDIDRFRSFVPRIEQAGTEACWMWEGKMTSKGHPVFWDSRIGEWTTAARWAYDSFRGPVDPTQRVMRTCGQKACVNPFHGDLYLKLGHFRSGPL